MSATCSNGHPFPLGASITQHGVNFAVRSFDAQQLWLCLFNEDGQEICQYPFMAKTHDTWHMEVAGLSEGQAYGLRAQGPFDPSAQFLFNPQKLLIDPYALALSEKLVWHPNQSAIAQDNSACPIDSAPWVPKSIVASADTSASRPARVKVKDTQRCIYELHVKGFSKQLDIDPKLQGTYLGVISEAGITHLQQLGVTTIQLMPCFSFANEKHLQELKLSNYWGYNPISFFAVEESYALQNPIEEFKRMVDGLRLGGFEVILDVVYNHTAESEANQASVCFRGLDNRHYYRHQDGQYLNYTGCGNCIDTFQPNSIRLICDSMRYWMEVMGVDGFRFDLGVDLGRMQHDFSGQAPLLQAIRQDPLLSQACLVMEPWDIGPGGYQVGQFPNGFLECNDKYRDTIRRFWRGDQHSIADFATRIMGSRDVFHKGHRDPLQSVNYITYHDGYTLHDLVSYHDRHNLANMEGNRDGHTENISQNFGVEGETEQQDILEKRLNQQLCFIATLLLSQGTPHLLGGDELSHSQQGNNNAYCQDNKLTWLDWQTSPSRTQLENATAQLLAIRKRYPILANIHLPDDDLYQHLTADQITWLNEQGGEMQADHWHEAARGYLAILLTPAHQQETLWLVFYRDDTPMQVPLPSSPASLEVLFSTAGMQLEKQHLVCHYRGVLIARYR
ncbi:glycogen debranching protein GlgX [Marinomonas epiphytica]